MVIVNCMVRTTIIVTDKNFRITIPEEIRMAERITQGDMIEIDVKNLGKHEDRDCIKKILTNKDKDFFKINSKGNNRIATIKLFPWATTQRISIPVMEGYGIKLKFNDANGNEIPDDAIIELWKEKISEGHPLGEYEYKELKKGITPLKNQINIYPSEELVIYVEEKYAGKIQNIEFRFAIDLCVKRENR